MNGALFSYPRPNGCGLEAVMSSFKHLQTCRQLCCSSYQINMSDRHGSTPNPFRRNTFSCFGIDVPAWRAKKKIQVTPKWKAGLGGLVGVSWNADLHQYVTPQNPGNCGKSLNNKASIVGSFPSVAVCQDVVTLESLGKELHIAGMAIPCAVAQARMHPASRQEAFALPKTPGQSDDRHLQMNLAQWIIPAHCLGREMTGEGQVVGAEKTSMHG